MKIEDVINVMGDVSESLSIASVHQAAAELHEAMKALEQHHKDLMGLVERLRDREAEYWKRKDDYSFGLHQAYGYAADDLESLINPKD